MHAVFFEEDDAGAVVAGLRRDGFEATTRRGRFAGEDDDEGQPWVVDSDAPSGLLELLAEAHDGWVEHDTVAPVAPFSLPAAPRRTHRRPEGGDGGGGDVGGAT